MKGRPERPMKWSAAADRAREELLRPCPYLGYDHDRIGVHCLGKDAPAIAEKSFLRAIWLNPYEPRFVLHLAHARFRLKRYQEAVEILDDLNSKWPDFKQGEELRATIMAVTRGTVGRKD